MPKAQRDPVHATDKTSPYARPPPELSKMILLIAQFLTILKTQSNSIDNVNNIAGDIIGIFVMHVGKLRKINRHIFTIIGVSHNNGSDDVNKLFKNLTFTQNVDTNSLIEGFNNLSIIKSFNVDACIGVFTKIIETCSQQLTELCEDDCLEIYELFRGMYTFMRASIKIMLCIAMAINSKQVCIDDIQQMIHKYNELAEKFSYFIIDFKLYILNGMDSEGEHAREIIKCFVILVQDIIANYQILQQYKLNITGVLCIDIDSIISHFKSIITNISSADYFRVYSDKHDRAFLSVEECSSDEECLSDEERSPDKERPPVEERPFILYFVSQK